MALGRGNITWSKIHCNAKGFKLSEELISKKGLKEALKGKIWKPK